MQKYAFVGVLLYEKIYSILNNSNNLIGVINNKKKGDFK